MAGIVKRWLALLCLVTALHAGGQTPWTWKDGNGVVRERKELDRILLDHKTWVESKGTAGKRADLTRADLKRADLTGANLIGANLTATHFENATLAGAHLEQADLTQADFTAAHLENAYLTGAHGSQTDFTQAILNGAGLQKATLTEPYFGGGDPGASGASLEYAHLSGIVLVDDADFTQADLRGADFSAAVLVGADFTEADLTEADLSGANLGQAKLTRATLTRARLTCIDPNQPKSCADLTGASLTHARVDGANLKGASIAGTDLESAVFSLANYEPGQYPDTWNMSRVVDLSGLTFIDNSEPTIALRNSLRDGGFALQEREVNEAYRRHNPTPPLILPACANQNLGQQLSCWTLHRLRTTLHWLQQLPYWTQQAMFDWTCGWGAKPERPLKIIVVIILLCTPVYWIGMQFQQKRGGLYIVANLDPVPIDGGTQRASRMLAVNPAADALPGRPWWSRALSWLVRQAQPENRMWQSKALRTALLFSLMSAFRIGFEGFNGALWIQQLQPRQFDLQARGWMRSVSGAQSLLGAGLLALSILTYIGNPFE